VRRTGDDEAKEREGAQMKTNSVLEAASASTQVRFAGGHGTRRSRID
jgi:hypothetical protein